MIKAIIGIIAAIVGAILGYFVFGKRKKPDAVPVATDNSLVDNAKEEIEKIDERTETYDNAIKSTDASTIDGGVELLREYEKTTYKDKSDTNSNS